VHVTSAFTDLLNRHDHLYSVETVQTEIVVEVRFTVELCFVRPCPVHAVRLNVPWRCP
jgi:hypothetical protein